MATDRARRDDFLIEMYEAMWDNINRHIGVIWQSMTVLLGAGAVFSLVERDIVPVDFAITLIVIIAAWQVAHVYDASYWVNRNLAIIRNLERQFLSSDDLRGIHYYFGRTRKNTMIEHFKIQFGLGVVVGLLALLYHGINQGKPMDCSLSELIKGLPYLTAILGGLLVILLRRRYNTAYSKLLEESPGAAIAGPSIQS